MERGDQDQAGPCGHSRPMHIGELPLRDLFPYWTNLLWKESMRPMIEQLFQLNLTMSESQILRHLYRRSLAINHIAEYLVITPSAASRAIDRLVSDGFVSRTENPSDRRQKMLQLTPKGIQLVETLNDTFSSGIERLVAALSPTEQEQFRQLIARILAAHPESSGFAMRDEGTE